MADSEDVELDPARSCAGASPERELHERVLSIHEASLHPESKRTKAYYPDVDYLCRSAAVSGLQTESLHALLDTITLPGFLDQATVVRLIKHCYPANKVSTVAIIRVIGCFGAGEAKPSLVTQEALLRWLVLSYSFVADTSVYSKLYGTLFNALDMMSLRTPLCHLLALITRRQHVKPFRIQNLLELSRTFGNEPALMGLIRVFKDFYPDVIVTDIKGARGSVFTTLETEWQDKALRIYEAAVRRRQDLTVPTSRFRSSRYVRSQKAKGSGIPELQTSRATEASTTLEEVEDVQDFADKIERLELPNQLISILTDPLLQRYLSLNPSIAASERINNWLEGYFLMETQQTYPTNRLSAVLKCLLEFTRRTKIFYFAAQRFLERLLSTWDGVDDEEAVLGLISMLPLRTFEDLENKYLRPLEQAFLDGEGTTQLKLLRCYIDLLRGWGIQLVLQPIDPASPPHTPFVRLLNRVEKLALATAETTEHAIQALDAVLVLYECISEFQAEASYHNSFRLTVPINWLVYQMFFKGDIASLSRVCGVLTSYKLAFQLQVGQNSRLESEGSYSQAFINRFNAFLVDICNCIWRNRAFNRDDTNSAGCFLPTKVEDELRKLVEQQEQSLSSLFSLSHSYTLASLAIQCFRDLEDSSTQISIRHAGPITQRSLHMLAKRGGLKVSWTEYRLAVIANLEKHGASGISHLMHSTVKPLAKNQVSED